jgi:hypothetical protein
VFTIVVGVHVHEAGDDGLSGGVHYPVNPFCGAITNTDDPASVDQQGAILHHFVSLQGDDAGSREGDGSLGNIPGDREPDVHRVGGLSSHGVGVVPGSVTELHRLGAPPTGEHPALLGEGLDGELPVPLVHVKGLLPRAPVGEGGNEDVVAFLEGHPLPIGGGHGLIGVGEHHVLPPTQAIGPDTHQHRFHPLCALLELGPEDAAIRPVGGVEDGPTGYRRRVNSRRESHSCNLGEVPSPRGNPHYVPPGVVCESAAPLGGSGALEKDQFRAIGAPGRVDELCGSGRELDRISASGADLP